MTAVAGPAPRSRNLVLAAMIFAVSMTFIDQTIISIAVPKIQRELSLTTTGAQWTVNAYLLALAALFAYGGRLADTYGHRKMVTLGVIIFAGASLLCGLTPTGGLAETWLVVFRAVQGAGGAIMFPAALGIVVQTFPLRSRGRALALFFGIAGGLTAVGPILGGYLTEWTWRAIFWVNIPIAIIALILIAVSRPETTHRWAPMDYRGLALIVAGIGLSVFGFQQSATWGWTNPAIEKRPALPRRDIGNVTDHLLAGNLGSEVRVHQVRDRPGLALLRGLRPPWPRLAGDQAQLPHDPADQVGAGRGALPGQLLCDPPVPVRGIRIVEDAPDDERELLPPFRCRAFRPRSPVIEPGFRHHQPCAHLRDSRSGIAGGVLRIDELVHVGHRCSAAKYAAAFERNSRLCIAAGLILLVVFYRFERGREHPLIDVGIFRSQPFTVENLVLFVSSMAFIPIFFFASQYAQIALAERAQQASLVLLYFFIGYFVGAQLGGRMLDRIGAKRPVVAGCVLAAVGLWLWASDMTGLSLSAQTWYIILAGGGMGLMLGPASTDAVNRATRTTYGEATGITQTVRNYAASLGVAILGTILVTQMRSHLTTSLTGQGLPHSRAAALAWLSQSRSGPVSSIPHFARLDFAQASQDIFYVMAAIMAAAAVIAFAGLRACRQQEAAEPAGAAAAQPVEPGARP